MSEVPQEMGVGSSCFVFLSLSKNGRFSPSNIITRKFEKKYSYREIFDYRKNPYEFRKFPMFFVFFHITRILSCYNVIMLQLVLKL